MPNNPPFPPWSSKQASARQVLRCATCGAWSYDDRVLCEECRAPLVTVKPRSQRIGVLVAFALLLVSVVVAIVLLFHWV